MKRSAKEVNESILSGLEEAALHAKGNLSLKEHRYKVSPLPKFKGKDIKSLRSRLHFTQIVLANTIGVSIKTVEAWESGRNMPQGPAQRMLQILNSKPSILKETKILQEKGKNSV